MQVEVKQGGIQTIAAEAVIINLFEGVTTPGGATGIIDKALSGLVSELIASGDVSGKLGHTSVLYPRGAIPARRVIVVGLGRSDGFDLEAVREAAGAAILQARKLGAAHTATIIHGGGIGGLDISEAAQAVVEGSLLALYRYDELRTKKEAADRSEVETLTLVEFDQSKIGQIEAGAAVGQIIAEAVYLARTWVNRPSNIATPPAMAQAAHEMAVSTGLLCRVLDETAMRAEGMNLLLAVTQGASKPAQFVILEYKPAGADSVKPVVLVGKGVAFDTGGYTLKTASGMSDMKGDMGGAAAVMGAMQAVARLKLPLPVVGLLPLVENVVSDTAYKPCDVFTARNGLTVEITSTDAEGRLILADALSYADTFAPAAVIDVATLTGGKTVALGNRTNALFANRQAQALSEALLAAGQDTGEPLWRMPLDPAYDRQLKSDVADLKNSGGRAASCITAARFLAHFIGEWPWVHLDIASSEFYDNGPENTPRSYLTKGATGIPLRTLVAWLRQQLP